MPSKNIKDAHPRLQEAWPDILSRYEQLTPGYTLWITCTHRTPEEQFKLFREGRNNVGTLAAPDWQITDHSKVVTNCDGDKKVSKHNLWPAEAIDVQVIELKNKKVVWSPLYYEPLIDICGDLDLTSGGSWKTLQDWPHIEIKKGSTKGGPGFSSAHLMGALLPPPMPYDGPDDSHYEIG